MDDLSACPDKSQKTIYIPVCRRLSSSIVLHLIGDKTTNGRRGYRYYCPDGHTTVVEPLLTEKR